jgi:ABC-type polysaccharide/polyol phosphate export permease
MTMVLMLGVLGNGFFGGGIRMVIEREQNILRRFKVAPITPAPILVASIVTGWVTYMPAALMFLAVGRLLYHMDLPQSPVSLFVLLTLGMAAFRSMGLIVASVVNTMAESQIIIQLLYFPMLMLSGATIPLSILPEWTQQAAQFLPATHLNLGLQGILVRGETLRENLVPLGALLLATAVCLTISAKLFRWEKEERIKASGKLWVLAALAPFIVLGAWQLHSKQNVAKSRILDREMRRSRAMLLHDARLIAGDGQVFEHASVLVRNGRIEEVFEGRAPDADQLRAEVIEASGKTVLPAFIDTAVQLAVPAADERAKERALAAYLYCGITAVGALDPPEQRAGAALKVRSGEALGAEVLPGRPPRLPSLALAAGGDAYLRRSLVEQVGPPGLLEAWQAAAKAPDPRRLEAAGAALRFALADGAEPVLGTLSGHGVLLHGAALHRELQLWVEAGVPARTALAAATVNAARALGAGGRLGLVRRGYEASLVVVEGNPLEDIAATERIIVVIHKGERIARGGLFEEFDGKK